MNWFPPQTSCLLYILKKKRKIKLKIYFNKNPLAENGIKENELDKGALNRWFLMLFFYE